MADSTCCMSSGRREADVNRNWAQKVDRAEDGEFRLIEAGVADVRNALDAGMITAVELVALYLNRIARYDRSGPLLNAVPIINPDVFADAARIDAERRAGAPAGPLHGLPYVVKDSYKVAGLTVASGSPAFAGLVANEDSHVVERLREAGAIVLGKTTMPPMAAGGMQRGLYGRAESPYNPAFLAAAWFSGSSNGSGVATAANLCAFALGEETVSSGRSPASNNGLVAYTPSRGVLSMRGNWPLLALRDVVVPLTRTVPDLLEILNILVEDDPRTDGDLWRRQSAVTLPAASSVRPHDYRALADERALQGKRVGVPRIYVGAGMDLEEPIELRPSIRLLWERAVADLQLAGAEVREVDLPLIREWEKVSPDARDPEDRGLVPDGFMDTEFFELAAATWDEFLRANADPALHRLGDVDPDRIFPDDWRGLGPDVNPLPALPHREIVEYARGGTPDALEIEGLADALRGLEQFRKDVFEDWLEAEGLDVLAFPANTDVGRANADADPQSSLDAWRNGVACSTGNFAIRHLGIPTVTVCMGLAADISMPVGVTFAGPAYSDKALLGVAYAYEQLSRRRTTPPGAPELAGERFPCSPPPSTALRSGSGAAQMSGDPPEVRVAAALADETSVEVEVTVACDEPLASLAVSVDGTPIMAEAEPGTPIRLRHDVSLATVERRALIVAVGRTVGGVAAGAYTEVDIPARA